MCEDLHLIQSGSEIETLNFIGYIAVWCDGAYAREPSAKLAIVQQKSQKIEKITIKSSNTKLVLRVDQISKRQQPIVRSNLMIDAIT